MSDDSKIPEIHPGQGEMLDRDRNEGIRPEALPEQTEPEEDVGTRQAREAAENQGRTYYRDIDVAEEIKEIVEPTEEVVEEVAEQTLHSDEMTPGDKLEMCESAAMMYFGVHMQDFADNFDHWAEEYEKESSDRSYKNKIWLVTKLISGDPELRASVVNQAKLAEIAVRL